MHSINVYGINNKWIDKWVVRLVMGFRTCYPQIWHLGIYNILSFVVKGELIRTNVGSSLEVAGVGGVRGSAGTVSLQKNTGEFGGMAGWTALHLVCIGGYIVMCICPNSQSYTLRCVKWTVNKIC